MKVLLDECVPKKVKRFLPVHEVFTAQELGLASVKNGRLLAAAESAGFTVLITCDKSMPYQQRLTGRSLAVVQMPTNRLEPLKALADIIKETVDSAVPGNFYEVTAR